MRKAPTQERSRQMVQRLLEATSACVADMGLDNTTTNHIAERAGVSVGSLYQYFPNKESLLEALLEKMGTEVSQTFRQRAVKLQVNQLPLRDVAFNAIRFGIMQIKRDPLMEEIISNWSRLPIHKLLDPMENLFLVMAQPYFLKNYRDYPIENLESKLYVLINSTLFTAIRYLNQQDSVISEEEIVHTLTDMIVGLLEPGVSEAIE